MLKSIAKSVGVICVITKNNVSDANGILNRLSKLGVNGVSFCPFKRNPYANDVSIESEEWSEFLIESFEFWLKNNHSIKNIEPINSTIQGILGANPPLCTYKNPCFKHYLCVYPQGDVYPCSALTGPNFLLGNMNVDSFSEIFENLILTNLRKEWLSKIEKKCSKCSYIRFCYGCCPEYSYSKNKKLEISEDECKSRKQVFSYNIKQIKKVNTYKNSE